MTTTKLTFAQERILEVIRANKEGARVAQLTNETKGEVHAPATEALRKLGLVEVFERDGKRFARLRPRSAISDVINAAEAALRLLRKADLDWTPSKEAVAPALAAAEALQALAVSLSEGREIHGASQDSRPPDVSAPEGPARRLARPVEITEEAGRIFVKSPYNGDFVSFAKRLKGRFGNGVWTLDARDKARVAKRCLEIYGAAGEEVEVVTVKLTFGSDSDYGLQCYAFGRPIARASGRDSGARTDDGVLLLAGGFGSGGSMKNPTLTVREGTTVLVRDVPRRAVEAAFQTGKWSNMEVVGAEIEVE